MMDKLLQGVLQGEFPVGSAVQWMNGDNSVSPPPHLLPAKTQTAWQTEGPTPEGFKAFILNFVRDQAEFILSAAEKKGSASRGGTPQPSGPNTFGSGLPITRSKRTEAEHLRQLESVARRLDPGAVDDTNFPSLGGGNASNGTQNHSVTAAMGISPKQMKRIVATPIISKNGGGNGNLNAVSNNSGNTPRRRIQPTQVAEVEVSKQFVTAQLSEPSGSFSSKLLAPSTTSKLASRLDAMGLDENPFLNINTTTTTTSAAVSSLKTTREITPQKEAAPSTLDTTSTTIHGVDTDGAKPIEFSTPLTSKLNFGDSPILRSSDARSASSTSAATALEVPLVPKLLPLSASGHALASLHAGILRVASDISLTAEVNLILNLLAVPLIAQVDPALVACPELVVLLTCGAQSQQYAALVLQHAGGLLKGLGLQLLEEIATIAAATATAFEEEEDITTTTSTSLIETSKLLPSPTEVMNTFKKTASTAEIALRSRQLRTEKAFNRITAAASRNSIAGGVGLHAFTADGVRSRSIEDQRRVSNREACRDLFFGLMRDASGRAAFFGRTSSTLQNNNKLGGGGGPVSVSLSLVSGADGRSHTGEPDGVVFGRIQVSASNLLRTLRPDNFSAFAELLTAAILQAAATGDALMDDELAKLAKRDGVSRFHSLNRRMQGGESSSGAGGGNGNVGSGSVVNGAVGPRRSNSIGLSRLHSNGSTSIGFGNNSTDSSITTGAASSGGATGGGGGGGNNKKGVQPNSSPFKQTTNKMNQRGGVNTTSTNNTRYNNNNSGGGGGGGGNSSSQLPAGAQAAMDEAASLAASIMSEFPRSLGLYILFLEAADSHRLNTALTRVMTEKLKALAKPQTMSPAAAGQSLGEKVVAASALAGILGYLAFAKNSANPKPAPWDSFEEDGEENGSSSGGGGGEKKKSNKYDGSHPVDVAGALHASLGTSHVLRTIPWVTRYLHFLKWDSEAVETPYFKSLLCTLGDLKCAPELSPGGCGFGPAALCLRSLLDDFSTTVLPLPTSTSSTNSTKSNTATSAAAESAFGTALASSDQLIDLRYVDLCCPVLAHARRLFTSEGGVVLRSEPRRILPTAPLATAAAVAPPLLSTRAAAGIPSPKSSPDTFGSKRGGGALVQKKQHTLVGATTTTSRGGGASVLLGTCSTRNSSASNIPSTMSTATNGRRAPLDPVKLRLQQTFLQQYSQEDRLVKLKDVVEYCSDVIGCNAATGTVAKLAPAAIKTASDELVALVTEHALQTSGPSNTENSSNSIEQQQIELERFSNAAAEKATAATIKQVLNAAFEAARDPIKVASTRAVVGLVSTELGDAVIATAAAMVAETAEEACSGRLPALVQKAIRQDDLAGHAKSAVKAIIKERKKLQQQQTS